MILPLHMEGIGPTRRCLSSTNRLTAHCFAARPMTLTTFQNPRWWPMWISTGGSLAINDAGTANQSRRFYRATLQAGGGSTFNDFFSNRTEIVSPGATVFGSNVGATKEPGELNHGADAGGKSVWWTWTAPT